MSFLTDWLTTIILIILLATILELMLPKSSMQRYVKMVVGLLLIVVMLQPLLSLFNEDVDEWLFSVVNSNDQIEQSVEESIKLQKRDIEMGQRAYISEQVAVHLGKQVESELQKQHSLIITNVDVTLGDDFNENIDEQPIRAISVRVKQSSANVEDRDSRTEGIMPVQVVQIDTTSSTERENESTSEDLEAVQQFLSDYWDVPKELILLAWEGGKRVE